MDLELHVVHTYPDGSLGAVIGVLFDQVEGGMGDNLFLNQIEPILNTPPNQKKTTGPVSLLGLLDSLDTKEFFSYDGSLTTPPCTEGIKWSVLCDVQSISPAQIKLFNDLWMDNANYAAGKGNNRVVQPLNERDLCLATPDRERNPFTMFAYRAAFVATLIVFVIVTLVLSAVIVLVFLKPQMFKLQKKSKNAV